MGMGSSLSYATPIPEMESAVVVNFPATNYFTDPDHFVSKIRVPTLIFSGGRDTDKNCCAIETARKLSAAVKRQIKPVLEVVKYTNAGHGWVIKPSKTSSNETTEDALPWTLAHMRQYLGQ
jgi:hypothetical protein